MAQEKTNEIQTRASPKQLNAFYAIQMRIARKQIQPELNKFGQLPIKEASEVLTKLMLENPAPKKPATQVAAPTTQQVVAPTGVRKDISITTGEIIEVTQ